MDASLTIQNVQFRVLGLLEVTDDRGPIVLGGPKQRQLLAALISRVGESVSADALVDAVWVGRAPRSATKTLQGYIVHLRQALAGSDRDSRTGGLIVTSQTGYGLMVPTESVDAVRFTMLVTKGRQSVAFREWPAARVFLREGLSLWRGNAYAEFAGSEFLAAEAARLEQLKLVAMELGFQVDLELGEDIALIPELEKALAEQPTRERLWELLIRALYRAGRQSDALAAYGRARTVLATELGVDPGPELRAVQIAVLSQDPSLESNRGELTAPGLSSSQPSTGVYAFDGRDADLDWLRAQWLAAIDQGGRVAVVSGPSGIGKTRLIAAFANEIERSDSMVVRRTGLAAPSLAAIAAVAAGRPALVALDDPLTGLDPRALAEVPVLTVAAVDTDRTPPHVLQSLASAAWHELDPLTDEVSARIAKRWIADDGDGIDVNGILTEARGIPGKLHRLLAEAVDRRSRREIDSSASELRSARADIMVRREQLAHSVRSLRRGRALYAAMPGVRSATPSRCPYRGLQTYEAGDAALFHGRDAVISQLVARVADTALVAVVGASGSGKSSLVRAGLLVALSDGCLPGSGSWHQFITTPADALPIPPATTPAIVVVDQFEQAWAIHDAEARRRYIDTVMALADAGHRVVLTLRADHVERCAEHVRLREALAEGTVLLGPMSSAELSEVITGPAEVAGYTVEPALIDLILDDVRGLPTPLPLLSTALADTWESATGSTLTIDAYAETGGVAGSLARRAESVFMAMDPDEQAAVRRVFLRLASGEPGMLIRRRCPYSEAAADEPARRAIEALAAARLITVDATAVEVTHEALFENWPRLADWLDEDEQGRRLRAHLAPTAQEWDRAGRRDADLYTGVRLDAALDWASDHTGDLTAIERDFLHASQERADRELQTERMRTRQEARARRRLRTLLTAVATAAAVAIAATVVALLQRQTATDKARLAVARQLSAAALVNQPLDRSLLLAVTAVRVDNNVSTRSDLLAALQRAPAAKSIWPGTGQPLFNVVLCNHDRFAVAAGTDGVSTWDLTQGRTPVITGEFHNDWIPVLATRPGADDAVAIGNIRPASQPQPIQLWDLDRPQQIGPDLDGATSRLTSLSWSPDGRWLAAAQTDGDVLVWDVDHPSHPPSHIKRAHPAQPPLALFALPFPAVAYAGPDTFAVVERSGYAQISRRGSAQPIRSFQVGANVSAAASDPQGTLAVGHDNGTITLVSLATDRTLPRVIGHSRSVAGITFSADGHLLASVGADNAANVSDLTTGRVLGRLVAHTAAVTGSAFTADGRTLYTSSVDGTLIGWDVANPDNFGTQLQAPGAPTNNYQTWMAVSPPGDIAATYADGTVRFWARNSDTPSPRIHVTDAPLSRGEFSPDGRVFVTGEVRGTTSLSNISPQATGAAYLVDVRSGKVSLLTRLPHALWPVAFSPDGKKILLIEDAGIEDSPGQALLFDATSRQRIAPPFPVIHQPRQLAWSPDSRMIAVGSWLGGGMEVYDLASGRMLWGRSEFDGLAWSPNGLTVATGGNSPDGIQLRRATDGSLIQLGWPDHTLPVSIAYSPDGSILASGGGDGTVVLRDVATGDQIGPPLVASYDAGIFLQFDSAGHLIVFSDDGGLWRWDIGLTAMIHHACAIAGRNLTQSEWAELHTGRHYTKPCP